MGSMGGVFWIILLVIVVLAVAYFVRLPRNRSRVDGQPSGLDVLEGRYARGEINRDEYLQKKRDMLGGGEG